MLWNMKGAVIPIVIGALGTVPNGKRKRLEELEIRGRIDTIQTSVLLRSVGIYRRILKTWEELLSLKHQGNNKIQQIGTDGVQD